MTTSTPALPFLLLLFLAILSPTSARPSPRARSSPSKAPLGPSTLGTLQGYSSLPGYDNPATRAEGFGEWLGWRPRWDNACLDFSHFTLYPSFFIQPFNVNATDARITLQLPAMFDSAE